MSSFGVLPYVLTVDPKYASYPQKDDSLENDIPEDLPVYKTKTFELYSLYARFSPQKEVPYGGFVNEKNPGVFQKISRFIRGNIFLPDPRKGWVTYAVKKALEIISDEDIDLVITTGPPHSTHFVGKKVNKKTGIKWVADFRDPWTDIYYYKELMQTYFARQYDLKLEASVLSGADRVLTVSEGLKATLEQKAFGLNEKIVVLPNGFDETDFVSEKFPEKGDVLQLSYIGTMTTQYKIEGFLKALKIAVSEGVNLKLNIIGKYSDEIKVMIRDHQLEDLTSYPGYFPHEEIPKKMQQSDVLLLFIPDVENNKGILTGKIFEYIGSGTYVFGVGPQDSDASKLIKQCEAGCYSNYNETEEMAELLASLYKQKQSQGLLGAPADKASALTRKAQAQKLAEFIQEL